MILAQAIRVIVLTTVAFMVAKALGYMIGDRIYLGLIEGKISREFIQRLFYYRLPNKEAAIKILEKLLQNLSGIKSKYRGKIDHL